MKILIDNKIPYIRGEFEPWADVMYLPADGFTRDVVRTANLLVVRTRTRCNEALLDGSSVQMIATATIGTDHIDIPWCTAHNIQVVSAPGCNAPAVGEWVGCALRRWADVHNVRLNNEHIAIIGYGHVGHEVEREAQHLGMTVHRVDPYVEGCHKCVEEVISQCRVATYHVPLNDETRHLCNASTLAMMRTNGLIINAARGGVVNEQALIEWLDNNPKAAAAIDCWEGEPNINQDLVRRCIVATPHIAGYNAEGKWRGTRMIVDAIRQRFGWQWDIGAATDEFLDNINSFEALRKIR